MKIGIIGSGGREHAICHALDNLGKVKQIYCFPGNAGTAKIAKNISINLENFNKKGLYLLIREMTGVQTSKITKVINIIKLHYIKMNKRFEETGAV